MGIEGKRGNDAAVQTIHSVSSQRAHFPEIPHGWMRELRGAGGMLDAVGHLCTLALVRQPENRTQGAVSLTRGSELYLAQGFAPPQMLRVARKPRPGVRDTPGVPRWLSPQPPNKSILDELRPEPKHTRGRELPPPFIAP